MSTERKPALNVSPVVAGLLGIAVVAIGALVGMNLRAATAPLSTSSDLRAFLTDLSAAQTNHKTQFNTYAADLETLTKAGLRQAPADITVDYRGSSPLGYCWIGKSRGSPVWFTVSQVGVAETSLPSNGPPPTLCKAP